MTIEDTFIPKYYRVQISGSGLGGTAPNDGFIDNKEPKEYDPMPTTLENSKKKERGNIRYKEIIRQLSINISPVSYTPRNINAPGRDNNTPPTDFDFTVVFSRPEYLRTEDEKNPGTFLTGTNAIKRYIARALTITRTDNVELFDPKTQTVGSTTVYTNPQQILEITTGSIAANLSTAEGNITVTEIANT